MKSIGNFFLGIFAGAALTVLGMMHVVAGVQADVAAAQEHARALEQRQVQTADQLQRVQNSESVCVRELATAAIQANAREAAAPEAQGCEKNAFAQIAVQYASGDKLSALHHLYDCARAARR
jgi:hypothetical protein